MLITFWRSECGQIPAELGVCANTAPARPAVRRRGPRMPDKPVNKSGI